MSSDLDDIPGLGGYIGKYRILAELGRGGMASVLLAVAQGPAGVQKLVALKVLRSAIAADPETLSMFLDEARLAAQLSHSNVVKTFEVGSEDDRYLIVMEYLEGQALSAVLRRAKNADAPMPLPYLLRVFISVLEGLHYAHGLSSYDGVPLRIVHRDMSPQNVFITYDGQVKVVDFGIAKATSSENHTATGVIKGKLAYMAPEQMMAAAIDHRADIYSVGCMLWAALTGSKLWDGAMGAEIARNVVQGRIPLPSSVNPECNPELERIVMKALAPDPDRRYQTALEFQADIERYCESSGAVIKEKEVGAYVARLFADNRTRLKAALERELRRAVADYRRTRDSGTISTRQKVVPVEVVEPTLVAPKRSSGWWAVGAVLLIAGAAWALYQRQAAMSIEAANGVHASPSGARVAERPTVAWTFSAEPAGAQLFLDGQLLPGNPVTKLLPREAKSHTLSASAEGHETQSQQFSSANDGQAQLSLNPAPRVAAEPPPPSAMVATNRRRRARGPATAPVTSSAPLAEQVESAPKPAPREDPMCDQPFFINSQGIKSVRPECM